jgi:hypothetical protein
MAKKRGTETAADMIRSLVVVLLPVAFIAGVVLVQTPSEPTVRSVDLAPVLASAREAAPFEVLAPQPLPDGWRVTQVGYAPGDADGSGTWRLNVITEDGTYVGLVQSTGELDRLVATELSGFEPDGESEVDGQMWTRYSELGLGRADRALATDLGDSVVVVFSSGDYSAVESFVSRLR